MKFKFANTTTNGKSKPKQRKPPLPFNLPLDGNYPRLIYFVPGSQANHSMAIVASKRLNDYSDAFTSQQIAESATLWKGHPAFSASGPPGIAVIPE